MEQTRVKPPRASLPREMELRTPPDRGEQYLVGADQRDRWYRFFYPSKRYYESTVDFGPTVLRAYHATCDCTLGKCDLNPPKSLQLFDESLLAGELPSGQLDFVLVRPGEVTAGTAGTRLAESLRQAAASGEFEHILLMTTCVPDLIGENPGPLGDELRHSCGVDLWWSPKTRPADRSIKGLVGERLGDVVFQETRDPRAILLAGIREGRVADELRALLAPLGVTIEACVLPDVSEPRLRERALAASTLAWVGRGAWHWMEANPFAAPLTVVDEVSPFGVEGTLAWARAVAEATGGAGAQGPEALLAPFEAALADVRERSRGRRVALVGSREDIAWLVARTRWSGFSVARLLCELGFDVVALTHAGEGERSGRVDVPPTPVGAGSISFGSFRDPAALEARLRDGVELAFSHFSHDPRLARLGIARFSESVFEPGLAGALRAGRRLLKRVEHGPFPGRLRAFLQEEAT